MKRLDFNQDGEIAEIELYKALAPYNSRKQSESGASRDISPGKVSLVQKERERISIYDILDRRKRVAAKYQSLKHDVSSLMGRYDTDGDGYVNFQELSDGLDHDNVRITKEEKLALMKHLDVDCDGSVSREEIFNALLVDSRH